MPGYGCFSTKAQTPADQKYHGLVCRRHQRSLGPHQTSVGAARGWRWPAGPGPVPRPPQASVPTTRQNEQSVHLANTPSSLDSTHTPPGTGGPSHLGIHLALIPPMHQTRPNTRTYGRAQTGQQNRTRADPGAQRNVRGRPNQPTATHAAPRRPARKAVGGAAHSASARQTHLRRASSQGLEPRSACGGEEG